jgi:hypothetical protein
MTLFRFLLARWLGPECAHGHLAAASVARAIEETA